MSETTYIYGLKQTDSDEIRYVGASIDPVVRMRTHLNGGSSTSRAVHEWTRSCRRRVELVILEEVPARSTRIGVRHPDVAEAEDRWMVRLLDEGHDLLNRRRPETHSDAAERDRSLMAAALQLGKEMFG